MRPFDNARLLMVAAAFFFATMAACIKAISPHVPLFQSVFFRSFISAVILGALLRHRGISLRAKSFSTLATRSLSGFLAMSCNFYVLGKLSLGDAALLVNTFPLFVALLSFLFLGERPSRPLLSWIFFALIGIGFILRPQLDFFNYAGFIALLSAIFSAIVVVAIHQSHETDPSLRIAFYFTATASFISLPLMLQSFVAPNAHEALFLLAAGLLGTMAQIVMTRAYGLEDVSRLAPLASVSVLFSFLLGTLFWGEIPTSWSLVGSGIVMLCCIQIARLEKTVPVVE